MQNHATIVSVQNSVPRLSIRRKQVSRNGATSFNVQNCVTETCNKKKTYMNFMCIIIITLWSCNLKRKIKFYEFTCAHLPLSHLYTFDYQPQKSKYHELWICFFAFLFSLHLFYSVIWILVTSSTRT